MYFSDNKEMKLLFKLPEQEPRTICDKWKRDCVNSIDTGVFEYNSIPILCQNTVCILNFMTQVLSIYFICSNRKQYKGSFFTLLITLSLFVIFRNIFLFLVTFMLNGTLLSSSTYQLATTISLHVDYFSNYFSVVLIFFMSLNRCLLFVKKALNENIFEGNRVIFTILFSALLSVGGSELAILISQMERSYETNVGFVDLVSENTSRTVNRIFYLFPVGSVVCYLVLFYHLKMEKQKFQSRNNGERNVFVQLLMTAVFYGIMFLLLEITNFIEWDYQKTGAILIPVLNTFYYLPELCLPLLLVYRSLRKHKRVSVAVAPSLSHTGAVTVRAS